MKRLLLILSLFTASTVYAAPPARLYNYITGTTIESSQVTANEDVIYNYLQAGVDVYSDNSIVNADVNSSAAILASKLNLSAVSQDIAHSGVLTQSNSASFTAITNLGTVTTADINAGSFDNLTSLTAAADLDIGSWSFRAGTLIADQIPSGRVLVTTTNGEITSDTDLTFSTDTLTATKIAAFSLTGKLTAAANEIEGSNFDIDGGTIDGATLGGAAQVIVTDADINGGTLDGVQIGGTEATGELIVNNASDDADGLGSQGSAGQFLKSAGTGANPTFGTAKTMFCGGGNYSANARTTLNGSGALAAAGDGAPLAFGGTLTNLVTYGGHEYTIMQNGSATALSIVGAGTDTSTVTVAAGDVMQMYVQNSGTDEGGWCVELDYP